MGDAAGESRFAFIIHPIDPRRDISRKYPRLARLPTWLLELGSLVFPPVLISQIEGVRSAATGVETRGWFIACPLTPRLMLRTPPRVVYRKIVQCGRLAERLGARILGLGAFTSVVGDGGISVARQLNIPVTTGDSYTVVTAVEAIRRAATSMERPLAGATLAVVGASGAIGRVCAQLLAPEAGQLLLLGRRHQRLTAVADSIAAAGQRRPAISLELGNLRRAHYVITVTSAVDAIIEPEHLRPGAVVCDVARPRDVSRRVAEARPDVLVIEGGMVAVPGPVQFNFDFGFPPGMAYACMAETMSLALEGRYESFTLGKSLQLSQVMTIDRIAARHGFKLGGFRRFERALPPDEMARVKALANAWSPV